MKLTPRWYQELDIEQAVKGHEGSHLFGDGMGTGKTLNAVEVSRRLKAKRVLIIAPLGTHDGWRSTIKRQVSGAQVFSHPPGSAKTAAGREWWARVADGYEGYYIIGWEAFRGTPTPEQRRKRKEIEEYHRSVGMALPPKEINRVWYPTGEWDLVIADEVHRACNRKSTTWKTLCTVVAKRKLALSGTPAGNKIEGFWAVLHWLWPEKYPHFWPWVARHCLTELDPHAGRKVVAEMEPGMVAKSIPSYSRRTLEEVAGDLPEVIERKVTVDLKGGVQKKAYEELENEAFTWLEGQPLHTPVPITMSMRLRQIALGVPRVTVTDEVDEDGNPKVVVDFPREAKSNKIDALKDIIKDIPEHEPILIFTHSARFVVPVVYQLNKMGLGLAVAWTGDTSQKGRQAVKGDFGKKGGPRFIVAGIAAIGEGVDGLQKRCSHEIWLSQHDNNMLNQQAQGRLHRSGQTKPVQRWIIQSKGTVDTKVYVRLEGNAKQMKAAYRKENPR